MFDLEGGWCISFAGCGFLGVYHIGVASCLVEHAPYLVTGASRICGASAGALSAAMLTTGASIAGCCEDVITLAKEARKRCLGPLHPSFKAMKVIREGLERDMPVDAHLKAGGKLCISLTRVSDGTNELVSDFRSCEELIQALLCSCFVPVYCGLIPPSFRGVRYVDGGMSDNLPQYRQKNTITVSPFSGESDICPRDNSNSLHKVFLTNTSIQVNADNLYRLSRALFPPDPKILGEMCQNGYKDALHFLKNNNLLKLEHPSAGLSLVEQPCLLCSCFAKESLAGKAVVTETAKEWVLRKLRHLRKQHWCLDEQIVDRLPLPLKEVFLAACREKHSLYAQLTDMFPVRVAIYMLLPCTLPVESAFFVAQRFLEWIPEVSDDVRWLLAWLGTIYQQLLKRGEMPMRNCFSTPAVLSCCQEENIKPRASMRKPHSCCSDPLWILTPDPFIGCGIPSSMTLRLSFFMDSQEEQNSKFQEESITCSYM